jgi:predicted HTH transcriptional regulator
MTMIDSQLAILEDCIQHNTYKRIETDRLELKDNSHKDSDWKEVYKTANAFLNSKGGTIIIGIHEDSRMERYKFTGYDARNEEKVKALPRQFSDETGQSLNLQDYFSYEIKNFMGGHLLIITVTKLPDAGKYAWWKGEVYERLLTGDQKLSASQIKAQREFREEMRNARELMPVANATIEDLDVEKLNDYIFLLNRSRKIESVKADIADAKSFLTRKQMIIGAQPTVLGMLTCGNIPEDFLHEKCEVDCYVEHPSREVIAGSKKIFRGTVIYLMQESERFVMQNIDTGISIERGGSSIYEYPPELIRESVNNSLAHRDYSIDRPVIIKVTPKKQIEIRNPGSFKEELLVEKTTHAIPVRRIIPNSKTNNPRLAGVLKVFDKLEGRGVGMASLTEACLGNEIDLPYYIFYSLNELSLVIPSGKLLDHKMLSMFDAYKKYIRSKLRGDEITEEQQKVLAYLYKSELANKLSRHTILLTKDNNHLQAISSLIEANLIYPHPVIETTNPVYTNNPVYILDRNLFKTDFRTELQEIYKDAYLELKPDYREVVNLIYEVNHFSEEKSLSASQIGNILWKRQGKEGMLEGFEDWKRKVRYITSRLEKSRFIKKEGQNLTINDHFAADPDLFR